MFRAWRIVGWVGAGAALCFATALLAMNLYVQSQGTQTRIQQELSQRLGMPLHIGRVSVTPWGGLRLSRITIPQNNPAIASPFLQAENFVLRVRLRSIFRRPLVIREIALLKPQVVWAQNAAGQWRVPLRPPENVAAASSLEKGARPLPSNANLSPAASAGAPRELPMAQPEIKRVKVLDGSLQFFDRQNRKVALFDGVKFSSAMREATSLRGEMHIDKVALRDRVFLSNLRAGFSYDPATIKVSGIEANVAKGQLEGDFSMLPQTQDSPFTVHADFRRVQAAELVAEAGGSKETVRGTLEGTLDAAGKLADPNALTGSGTIALRDGHVQQFALLAAVGQLLQIEELKQLDLQQAEAKYRLAGSSVLIDEMALRSPNLHFRATGSVDFSGKVALNSDLTINDKVRNQLFRGMRENFVATNQPGEYSLPFHVGGTLDKPKTDLMERAVGVDLKNIGGVIDALFGRGKNRKKKEPESVASPSFAPTPLPSGTPAP